MGTAQRVVEDLMRVVDGAAGSMVSVREEVRDQMRARVERILADLDVVSREEFDAMADVARRARAEQESLSEKVSALEARIAAIESVAASPTPKTRSRKKSPPSETP